MAQERKYGGGSIAKWLKFKKYVGKSNGRLTEKDAQKPNEGFERPESLKGSDSKDTLERAKVAPYLKPLDEDEEE